MRADIAGNLAAHFETDNLDNRLVLNALEDGQIRTHMNGVDTTEANKALFRAHIAQMNELIVKVRSDEIHLREWRVL